MNDIDGNIKFAKDKIISLKRKRNMFLAVYAALLLFMIYSISRFYGDIQVFLMILGFHIVPLCIGYGISIIQIYIYDIKDYKDDLKELEKYKTEEAQRREKRKDQTERIGTNIGTILHEYMGQIFNVKSGFRNNFVNGLLDEEKKELDKVFGEEWRKIDTDMEGLIELAIKEQKFEAIEMLKTMKTQIDRRAAND